MLEAQTAGLVTTPAAFYDLQALAPLKRAATSEPQNIDNLRKVASQFESLFMQMALKSMRSASLGTSVLDSQQSLFYRDMFDQQLAVQLSASGGLGLADLLVEQLSQSRAQGQSVNEPVNLHPLTRKVAAERGHQATVKPAEEPPKTLAVKVGTAAPHPADVAATLDTARNPHLLPSQGIEALFVSPLQVLTSIEREPAESPTDYPRTIPLARYHQAAALRSSEQHGAWDSAFEFVRDIWPHAVDAAQELGADPRVLVAQSALETGWGQQLPQHPDGRSSLNLFGIKAGGDWSGERVETRSLEFEGHQFIPRVSAFRAYSSVASSMRDYVDFLTNNPRYANALANASDPEKYSRELQKAGYATDPVYADKILRVLNSAPLKNSLKALSAANAVF